MEAIRNRIADMASACRTVLRQSNNNEPSLPKPLHPKHLLWMCGEITKQAHVWPVTRLHRWIGFVQAGILANQMLDLNGLKGMFDALKHPPMAAAEDIDLIDHLDCNSSFTLDLGGQG